MTLHALKLTVLLAILAAGRLVTPADAAVQSPRWEAQLVRALAHAAAPPAPIPR
jgi:hypothetical protein